MSVSPDAAEWIHEEHMRPYRIHSRVLSERKLKRDSSEDEVEQPSANWEPRLLQEAIAAITGPRNGDYGDPWDNHANTAEAWEWWLRCRFGVDVTLTALDVCMFNILQKASRLSHSPAHRDSWLDIAGYCGNAGACIDRGDDD